MASAVASGWFHTGDGGGIDDEHYVTISDRIKDVIISGGENVSSIEVEDCLYQHPAVAEACVIGVPDDKWGERPLACVAFRQARSATPEDLRAHLAASFAKWQLPDRFEFLDALPRTSTGKFFKAKLREQYKQ